MARLLPFETDVSLGSRDPKVIDLDGDEADDVFAALSSSTSRRALTTLHEEPQTASALAEELDTTLQNVQYHLGKLSDAGLIEVADIWYSETGTEMKVYAPTDSALVLFAGEGSTSVLRDALSRLVGAIAVLGLASLVIDRLARRLVTPMTASNGAEPAGDSTYTTANGDDAESAADGGGDGSGDGGGTEDAAAEPKDDAADSGDAPEAETEAVEEEVADAAADTPAATETSSATETPAPTETPTPTPEATPGIEGVDPVIAELYATVVEPGALFFLGGLAALALVAGWWYLNRPQ